MVSRDFSLGVADYVCVIDIVAIEVIIQTGAPLRAKEGTANNYVWITVLS